MPSEEQRPNATHHRLAVRQRQDTLFEAWCKGLGRWVDPRCKDRNGDDNGEPSKPGNNAPGRPPSPGPSTSVPTANPRPPSPTTTNQNPAPPVTTTRTNPPPTSNANPPQSSPSSRGSSQTTETKPSEPKPAVSSSAMPTEDFESSSKSGQPSALPISLGETSTSRAASSVPGTPTTLSFTSIAVTTSDGVAVTYTSTGTTVVTPYVPAPTDIAGGQGPTTGGQVGASAKSTNVGAIVGGVLGALALLVLAAFAVLLYQRRKRKRTAPSSEFLRRYGNTALTTPVDSNSPYASNVNLASSQMRLAPEYTQASYTHYPYEKQVERY